ncbi:hypothetical protein [Streptomyces oceani]|uniref:Uncharacterized protein n=1 Tax=Streptomyces oceani TaxID=1075402 RepID=A0A1E7KIZ3_9ACTN|nr:hypothetical protein [Streptomyces oceani]OEV03909.1 hypothetical protein AN216_09710 [Streptomyces oceani]
MQVNHVPPGRELGDLSHDEKEKTQAAGYIRETLGPAVKRTGDNASADSSAVSGGTVKGSCTLGAMHGWETKSGLKYCAEEWQRNVKQLENRLVSEAASLEGTNQLFRRNEFDTSSRFGGQQGGPRSPIYDF